MRGALRRASRVRCRRLVRRGSSARWISGSWEHHGYEIAGGSLACAREPRRAGQEVSNTVALLEAKLGSFDFEREHAIEDPQVMFESLDRGGIVGDCRARRQ